MRTKRILGAGVEEKEENASHRMRNKRNRCQELDSEEKQESIRC
jgi:hypothetical protein